MYQLVYSQIDGKVSGIKKTLERPKRPLKIIHIPRAEGNAEYQEFLRWNKTQKVPLDLNSIDNTIVEEVNNRELTITAQIELDKSDRTLLRCIENNISIPENWANYRKDLRKVVSGTKKEIPVKPEYPPNT